MPERPPITVAVPTFDGTRHLAETLRSVLGQTGVAFDLLVSDDRSADGTPALAREVAGDRARIVVHSERLGLAGNWNQCAALCRTPLLAIVHQDDLLRPGHLAAHAGAFGDGVGLVASASGVVDAEGRRVPAAVVERGGLGPADRTFAPGEALPLLAEGNPLRCSAVSIRVEAHAGAGGFDPSLRYVVDWDFWLRVSRRWPLAWLAAETVDVRWHPASETHRFATGTADLEETERLVAALADEVKAEGGREAGVVSTRARRRLARAYLNRAYLASRGGDGGLGRRCLTRAVGLWPGVLRVVAADPRLAARMLALWAAPGLTGAWPRRAH